MVTSYVAKFFLLRQAYKFPSSVNLDAAMIVKGMSYD